MKKIIALLLIWVVSISVFSKPCILFSQINDNLNFIWQQVQFNIIGKYVAALVINKLQPGTYEKTGDASGFGSGVCFCRLISGIDVIASRKMALLKKNIQCIELLS